MKTIALVFAVLAAGCATAPEQPFGTTGSNPDQLALVSVASSEVKILEPIFLSHPARKAANPRFGLVA